MRNTILCFITGLVIFSTTQAMAIAEDSAITEKAKEDSSAVTEKAEDSTPVSKGKELHDVSCLSCHVAKYPDDPNTVYSREDRTIKDYKSLASRVQTCGTRAVETSWFDDEFDAVTTYLNTEFYHFEQDEPAVQK